MSQGRRRTKSIPNKLWIARKRSGYPLKWVASLLGHQSISVVSEYEHGRSVPSLRTALKLARIYETPVADLFPEFHADVVREVEEAKERHAALKRHEEERARRRELLSSPPAIHPIPCTPPQSRASSRSPRGRNMPDLQFLKEKALSGSA